MSFYFKLFHLMPTKTDGNHLVEWACGETVIRMAPAPAREDGEVAGSLSPMVPDAVLHFRNSALHRDLTGKHPEDTRLPRATTCAGKDDQSAKSGPAAK